MSLGIKYSLRDLIREIVASSTGREPHSCDICKISLILFFSVLFSGFNYDFAIYTCLTHIPPSCTVLDDVTYLVMHRIFTPNL